MKKSKVTLTTQTSVFLTLFSTKSIPRANLIAPTHTKK
jgi:hypothetical protein